MQYIIERHMKVKSDTLSTVYSGFYVCILNSFMLSSLHCFLLICYPTSCYIFNVFRLVTILTVAS